MKKLALAISLLTAICSSDAEIRLVSFADVEVKPDTAIVKVYISQNDMDLAKLNKKLDAKLATFTNAVAQIEGIQALKILSKRTGIDETHMYRESNDMPTILRGIIEVYAELEPSENCISAFIDSATENNADLSGRYSAREGLVQYGLKDFKEPMAKAYEKAVSRARENAEMMAKASGLSIKKLSKVENIGSSDPCYRFSEHESEYPSRFIGTNPNVIRVSVVYQFTFETE